MTRIPRRSSVQPAALSNCDETSATVKVAEVTELNARLETFIREALDARSSLDAAKALHGRGLPLWTDEAPFRVPCWRQMQCQRAACLAYGKPAQRCWLLVGTLGGERPEGQFACRLMSCYRCVVLRDVLANPLQALGENMLTIVHSLQTLTNRLRTMATRDPLTGLRNRRYFDDLVPAQVAAAERRGSQLWMLSLDLDGFKRINDDFGHPEGDSALVSAAHLIESAVRASDLVFRVGGDEFLVLLLDANEDQTAVVVERIESAFRTWNRSQARRRGYTLAVSIGAACIDCRLGISASVAVADKRMYANKRSKSPYPSRY